MTPRRTFGHTWWGRAWIEALEGRAHLDPNRLPRGRTYARKGLVGTLDVTPGQITARVQGSRPVPYRVTIGTHRFSPADWETLLDTIGRCLGYTAALLDGELPPELAEHARASGVDLLPGPGDLRPRCSCPDSADPCKHAAAVCYLVADEVDADPFVLFLLRGREREEILRELRARRSRPARAEPAVEQGLTPKEAFAREPGPVPPLPPVPDAPAVAVALAGALSAEMPPESPPGTAPGTAPGTLPGPPPGTLRPDVLAGLATDDATVAWQVLTGNAGEVLGLSVEEDLARRAAVRNPATQNPAVQDRADRDRADRDRAAQDVAGYSAAQESTAKGPAKDPARDSTAGDSTAGDSTAGNSTAGDSTAESSVAQDSTAALAAAAGMSARELARWAAAWREAGRGGLAVLREAWQPPRGMLAQGRAELDDMDLPGETTVWRNRLTRGDLQLRYGRDGRWYRFANTPLGWLPAAPGAERLVDALS
jgi:uncharacterized Zn finger protein